MRRAALISPTLALAVPPPPFVAEALGQTEKQPTNWAAIGMFLTFVLTPSAATF
ncbi:MAG: hypothetical protein JWM91_5248 [Rhodospirillales bacterium]|nr:hypothetical protein [Rhodospirillales bacterium]